jgi:hypothetical protein
MRKRIVEPDKRNDRPEPEHGWIDLCEAATVEVTSEDPEYPIESVFCGSGGRGWRASQKGQQHIRLIFDRPLSLHRIQLHFIEQDRERTQEFSIQYSSAEGGPPQEIVRQQWNFSPAGSTSELEDCDVNIENVSELELTIRPDLSDGETPATLASWRVA